MKKRLWAGLLVLCLLFACSSIGASEEVFNQQSGDYDYLPLADGTARLVKYYGSEADLVVPAELDGLKVTEIADSAFSWNDDIERVTLPEGVEKIGSQLFAYSTFLEAVTFPSTLKEIGSNPFIGCDEALDITKISIILAEEAGLHVIQEIIVIVNNALTIDTYGEIGTKVGVNAKVVAEIVAVTNVNRNLHIAGTSLTCCTQSINLGTLHGVVDTCIDENAMTAGKHVLATHTQIETRLEIRIKSTTTEITQIQRI